MKTVTIDIEALYTLQDAAYMHAVRLDGMARELLMTGNAHDAVAAEPFRKASQDIRNAITTASMGTRGERA